MSKNTTSISKKSLPLHKKIQYFVQGNRGWVVQTMGLFVISVLVVSLFLWQDYIFDNKFRIIPQNQLNRVTTPQKTNTNNPYPASTKDYQISPEELAFIKSMKNKEYTDKDNSGDKLTFDIVNILDINPPKGIILVELSGKEYEVTIEPNTQVTTVEGISKKDGVIDSIRYIPVDSNPLLLLDKDATIGIFYSEPTSNTTLSKIKANSIVYLGSKLEVN